MPEELKPKPKPKRPISQSENTQEKSMKTNLETPPPDAFSDTTKTTNPRDLERERAKYAWEKIQAVKNKQYQKDYGSLARKMPTYIQVNGLAQTLAFLKAKGKEHHSKIFEDLSEWVCQMPQLDKFNGDLLVRILDMDSQIYRITTNESLAFLQWLKRFAEAEVEEEENK